MTRKACFSKVSANNVLLGFKNRASELSELPVCHGRARVQQNQIVWDRWRLKFKAPSYLNQLGDTCWNTGLFISIAFFNRDGSLLFFCPGDEDMNSHSQSFLDCIGQTSIKMSLLIQDAHSLKSLAHQVCQEYLGGIWKSIGLDQFEIVRLK